MAAKILSISYSEGLLRTREWILEQAGYEVTSALGFIEAAAKCRAAGGFDVVIIGHSLPERDKAELARLARAGCAAKILCLHKAHERPSELADISIDADQPKALIAAVETLLAQQNDRSRNGMKA